MSDGVKLSFGLRSDIGRMVSIEAVMRGLSCDCVCPACHGRLVAAKGDLLAHHFRHYAEDAVCVGARETALHMMAKQILCERLELTLPRTAYLVELGPIRSARQEAQLEGVRPDVLLAYTDEAIAVEFHVAHQVPAEKVTKLQALGIGAVEIDLSDYRNSDLGEDEVAGIVLHRARRNWLNEPRCVHAAREAEQAPARALELERRGPCLQELVAEHGGYHKITPAAWARFDAEVEVWKMKIRTGYFHG
jgi:hypothetical protein